jgi:methionyl-tRNA formyltransferase
VRLVVCAYSEIGHACLDELLEMGCDVRLVVTHEDAPGETIWFGSVAERARRAGVPVITPEDINASESIDAITAAAPELLLSFYYRNMMGRDVLALPSHGALNLHGSLLPRYRGRAPVNWVLVHGERETGVTLHYMDEKPDHGDIVAQRAVPIGRDDTALTLTRAMAAAARELLRVVVPQLEAGSAPRTPQDHSRSSYFGGRRPSDGEIDWTLPAESIRNLVRAVSDPWPGAFTPHGGGKLWVWAAETCAAPPGIAPGEIRVEESGQPVVGSGEGGLVLLEVEPEGGPRESGADWARRAGIPSGERLGRA